ncbi:hypothetical protein C8J57DRAFT_661195 [Mycena rebaudengoi]|nr:hypothetical protein C8J57DRAFT_661195 [Mycena rebaudengoi]
MSRFPTEILLLIAWRPPSRPAQLSVSAPVTRAPRSSRSYIIPCISRVRIAFLTFALVFPRRRVARMDYASQDTSNTCGSTGNMSRTRSTSSSPSCRICVGWKASRRPWTGTVSNRRSSKACARTARGLIPSPCFF